MMLLISQAMLWIVIAVLAIAVLALARQVGVLHERISPVGALALGQGPQAGERAPVLRGLALDGTARDVGGPSERAVLRLLFFVAPNCPICKQLLPTAQHFARSEKLELTLLGDGDGEEQRVMAARHGVPLGDFVNSHEVGMAYRIGKLPYAVLIDPKGIIVAQGLVNTREHLESLVSAGESEFGDVQSYLRARNAGMAQEKGYMDA